MGFRKRLHTVYDIYFVKSTEKIKCKEKILDT